MPQNFTAQSAGIPPETEYEKAPFRSRGASAGTLQIVQKKTPDIPARIQIRVVYTLQIDR
jgi:hypothetical protein